MAPLPSPVDQTRPRAGCGRGAWGEGARRGSGGARAGSAGPELGQQHEAVPGCFSGWLALLKARTVNSALLKMSNKGGKERKEKGKRGTQGGPREQVGTIEREGLSQPFPFAEFPKDCLL